FPGVHCDVGGGYPEAESGLSKIPLKWMLDEAKKAGLQVEPEREDLVLGRQAGGDYVPPNAKADMHESLTATWWLAEFIPKRHFNAERKVEERRMNLFRRRTIPAGALIHDSAYAREADYVSRLPPRKDDCIVK